MVTRLRERLERRPPGYPYTLGRTLAIYAGLMTAVLLAALDATIVATAGPAIVSDLGGLSSYAWVFVAYMLCTTVTVPIYGRLGDIYGRRRLFFVSIPLFIAGSLLCGLAQSMTELVVFRGIQGLGAGGVIPLAFATTAELVPPRERGRYVALQSSVFLTASVLGPTLGGLIVDNTSWRWVFFINLPVGAVSLLVIAITMPRGNRRPERTVDYRGAVLLTVVTTALLLCILGVSTPWTWIVLLAFAPWFVVHTRRAADPVIPVQVLSERIVATGALATGLSVLVQFGVMAFVTLFAQGVLGTSATSSGAILIPQTVGAVGATVLAGQWISRTGHYRICALTGPALMGTGVALLASMGTTTTTLQLTAYMVVVGIGVGLMMQTLMVAAQSAVPLAVVGSATSLIQFSRAIGTTSGVAIFGTIVNHGLPDELRGQGTFLRDLTPAEQQALADALRPAFVLGALICAAVFAAIWFGLEERPLRRSLDDPSRSADEREPVRRAPLPRQAEP